MADNVSGHGFKIDQKDFKGPVTVLLELIRKKKIDIYLISIKDIIKGFIGYINNNKDVLLDEISSFLYVAVLLLEYKSRNLLPSSSEEMEEDIEVDSELLLEREREYLTFKNLAIHLENIYDKEKYYCVREAMLEKGFLDILPDMLDDLSANRLSIIAEKLFRQKPEEIFDLEAIYDDDIKITVKDEMDRIIKLLVGNKKQTYKKLSEDYDRLIDKIICFLSLLELYKREKIEILQFERFGNIVIKGLVDKIG